MHKNTASPQAKQDLQADKEYIGLRFLAQDQEARIVALQATGELGRRIRDMGLRPGVQVKVIGRAPLKDPVALKINDFTLTLRNNEADHILVEPL